MGNPVSIRLLLCWAAKAWRMCGKTDPPIHVDAWQPFGNQEPPPDGPFSKVSFRRVRLRRLKVRLFFERLGGRMKMRQDEIDRHTNEFWLGLISFIAIPVLLLLAVIMRLGRFVIKLWKWAVD